VLDLQYTLDERQALEALAKLAQFGRGSRGVKLDGSNEAVTTLIASSLPEDIGFVILTPGRVEFLGKEIQRLRRKKTRILLETTCIEQAQLGCRLAVDGVIAKGHEAGGNVGEETTFVLTQRLLDQVSLPVWAHGGLGLHSASACYVAGAAGLVLDTQLWLTRECSLPASVKTSIARMDGSETVCLGEEIRELVRVYSRPASSAIEELRAEAARIAHLGQTANFSHYWRQAVRQRVGWKNPTSIWLVGQDAALARTFADRFGTTPNVIKGIRQAIDEHVRAACQYRPLDQGSPLAQSHGTVYPIVQGPMTRVSDTPAFAGRVADAGGLPFLALALMRAKEVDSLLKQTEHVLGARPWGVGILGFVPSEVRFDQLQIIQARRPRFALIAGGRPDQAQTLEKVGIATYLHVPSSALLKMFLESGACRFVFEGRESGGHVGPRSSFVLWEQMTEVLLDAISDDGGADRYHILFAGGIHNDRSAAMVAALAAPLAARGCRVGLLAGTAYLFTREAVETGAIQEGFQQEALGCKGTVRLESRLGHETRCARTPYVELFEQEKRRLRAEKLPVEELSSTLERLNLGRLRIAAKGIARNAKYGEDPTVPQFLALSENQQHNQGLYMIGQIAALRDSICTMEELHREISIQSSEWLAKAIEPAHPFVTKSSGSRPSDLAIIGMSCFFPKAGDLQTYWENILAKVSAITEIPEDRWDWRSYFDPDPEARDKVYSKWGGFLDEVPFDPMRYGLPPGSLKSIEPLQLLTLEVVRSALADAGYCDRPFARERTSVILGAGGGLADLGHRYAVRSGLPMFLNQVAPEALERLPEWTEDSFPGILQNVAAGRVANRFDLGGVNYTVDAACASSLAALYLAAHELESGNSEMVIVGAADTVQNPLAYLCFSKTHALSPRGQCRTFDESADGIVLSEGLAAIVLKRLQDAERDGDRIYAVIKGVGSSSDGREKSLTAPRPEGQILALQRAYQKAGLSPQSVGLIEAHGTGTVAGDRAEIEALRRVLEDAGAVRHSCAIGSVKSMIGHTKCAAGLAGLIKVAMALYYKVLPPTAGVNTPNRQAGFSESPLYVNSEARPWVHGISDHPRRGGVSSFGFGGTNFHAVLEEYTGDFMAWEARFPQERWPSELILLRAKTRQELVGRARQVCRALDDGAHPALCDLANTLWQLSRQEGNGAQKSAHLTLGVVASSLEDLQQKLTQAHQDLAKPELHRIENPRGIYFSDQPLAPEGRIAFLFPGQGSQYPDMVCELGVVFAEVREAFETADRVLRSCIPEGLSSFVFPPPRFTEQEKEAARLALMQTDLAQPALGAAELGVGKLLKCLGVAPDMVAGHSYGEYVALRSAGVFDDECLLRLSESRGRFIREEAGPALGTMAAVEAGRDAIGRVLEGIDSVWIANVNSPKQTVISGDSNGVDQALRILAARGISARRLPVGCAFHSPIVAAASDRLADLLRSVEFHKPQLEVFSNTSAAPYPHDPEAIRAILGSHLMKPVDFAGEVEAMYASGARVFVEVGPNSVLTGLAGQILRDQPHKAVATDVVGRSGLLQLQLALAQLGAEGVPIQLDRLFSGRRVRQLCLESLVTETQERPLPSTVWLVNGGQARPLKETKPSPAATEPRSREEAPVPSGISKDMDTAGGAGHQSPVRGTPPDLVPQKSPIASEQSSIQSPQELTTKKAATLSENGGVASGNTTEVMLQYQRLMNRFLDTQEQVMLAFLKNRDGASWDHEVSTSQGTATLSPMPLPRLPESHPLAESSGSARLVAPRPSQLSVAPLPAVDASPPAPASAVPRSDLSPNEEELTRRLINIVSERTGYPPEMLDLDLNLEGDLSISSIKKVEILGTFQRQCTETQRQALQSSMDKLARLRTLREVIEGITLALGGQSPEVARSDQDAPGTPGPSTGATLEQVTDSAIPRYRRIAVDAGAISPRSITPPEGAVLITNDGRGIASALAIRLRDAGARVIIIGTPGSLHPSSEGFARDLTDVSTIRELIAEARRQAGSVGGLIHLVPLRLVSESGWIEPATWRERLGVEVRSLFLLAREVAHDLAQARRAWFVATSALGGDFGMGATTDPVFPGQGAISGFVKALATEWPEVRCRVIDFDSSLPANMLADRLFEELAFHDAEVEVGRPVNRRLHLRTCAYPIGEDVSHEVELTSDSVVLVTGGARGITSAVAIELARLYQPTLILLGRSPLPPPQESPGTKGITGGRELKAALMEECRRRGETPTAALIETGYRRLLKEREMRSVFRSIEQAGAKAHYHSLDVSDSAAVADLINQIYQIHGRLDGVIHGAGIIEDGLVADKDLASYDRVLNTKVQGALALARSLRPESLKFLVFFSSVAGVFGNRGQADYGAANEVLNKLALALDRAWPARVVSMNWGPWADIGMVPPEVQQMFIERDVGLIKPAAGQRMFVLEIERGAKGDAEVILGSGPWSNDRVPPARQPFDRLPLLEQVKLSKSVRGDVEATCVLDPEVHSYLLHHQLDSRPVLPAAVALEIMTEVAQYAWPELEVSGVRDFRVLSGVVLKDGSMPIRISARLETQTPGKQRDVAVKVEIQDPVEESKFYQATVVLGERIATAEFSPPSVEGLQPFPLAVSEAYEQLLFQGPVFRAIEDIHGVSERYISATLIGSSPCRLLKGTAAKQWLIDPVIVDGAFQMAILWARHHSDVTVLPVRFAVFRRFAPFAESRVRCGFQARLNNGNHLFEAQVSFLDEKGHWLALVEGMEFSGSKSLNRLSGGGLGSHAA
jgi:acyl transferase domain-containing protein/NAD(P)H-dependent flavin oxidoreductase YrpB (nitropropane dioxygenase family)/NAD(P)-dependent dehydrogenase (short-subunit alcohol dehydrogenase family)